MQNWRLYLTELRVGVQRQERSRGIAGAAVQVARGGWVHDLQQQADQQIAPEQPRELLRHERRAPTDEATYGGALHDRPQGRAGGLAASGVQRASDLG
jgi:hypothetical protein